MVLAAKNNAPKNFSKSFFFKIQLPTIFQRYDLSAFKSSFSLLIRYVEENPKSYSQFRNI